LKAHSERCFACDPVQEDFVDEEEPENIRYGVPRELQGMPLFELDVVDVRAVRHAERVFDLVIVAEDDDGHSFLANGVVAHNCNYVSRIIEPITSRCAKFRFQSLNSSSMTGRLRSIALAEQILIEDDTLSKLVELSDGDMRRSITLLQSAQKLRGAKNQLRPEDVMEVAGVIPPERIAGLLASTKGSSFRTLQSAAQEMIYSAYPVDAILAHLLPVILSDATIGDAAKAKIAVRLAEAEHKLVQGADELLQLIDVCSFIAQSIAANV
jgi:DNA polymerase III delta prime subunit